MSSIGSLEYMLKQKTNWTDAEVQSKLHQYDAFKAEVRDYDKLIWGTPSVSAAITGVIFNVVFQPNSGLDPQGKVAILLVGTVVNLALLHGLTKHRFFQIHYNCLIDQLVKRLPMIPEPRKTEDVRATGEPLPKGYLYGGHAFRSLALAQALLVSSTVAAIPVMLSVSSVIVLFLFAAILTVLCMMIFDP